MKYIPLTKGLYAAVDDEFFEELSKHKWHACAGRTTWYARRDEYDPKLRKWKPVRMHREVIRMAGLGAPQAVDHKDRDGLNNTLANLRAATHSQNKCNSKLKSNNTSGHKGVGYCPGKMKWRARIMFEGKCIHLGYFDTAWLAAKAYSAAAADLHGEFARIA